MLRIGVDLGGTKIEAIAIDGDGCERARERVATPKGDYSATIEAIASLVSTVANGASEFTVGVGIPGCLSPATGRVKNANSTWLIGQPLDRDLEEALGRSVRIENDANCFAMSEARDGAGAGHRLVFGVILGTGVGGGLVIDGRLWSGRNHIAGEWGHNPLPWRSEADEPAPLCYCGQQACIETYLSGTGLLRGSGYDRVETMLLAPESNSAALLRSYENRLARALASVVNLLDPDVIVLGGGLSNIEQIYETVPSIWHPWIFSDRVSTEIVRNRHGDSSGVRGAAWLW